jgi:hypothetical protein
VDFGVADEKGPVEDKIRNASASSQVKEAKEGRRRHATDCGKDEDVSRASKLLRLPFLW